MISLLVDDVRDLRVTDLIARTYKGAVQVLTALSVNVLYLDHDLGPGKTGYDLLNFIFDPKIRIKPKQIILVTMNPVGRQNMIRAILNNGYEHMGQQIYERK